MITINKSDDPRILIYKSLKSNKKTGLASHLFIAEGIKVVSKLLGSNLKIESIFLLDDYLEEFLPQIKSKNISEQKIFTASKDIMNTIVGFKLHRGIIAIGQKPDPAELEGLRSPIMILNGIVDSENVGSLLRNALAFNCNSIIYDNSTSNPFLRRAVRVSMGTVFDANIFKSNNLVETISLLHKAGFEIIGAELSSESIDIESMVANKKTAIVFGSESGGIDREIVKSCDKLVQIPINRDVKSINVAASSAVIMHHINKQ